MSLFRVVATVGICGGLNVAIGAFNIWAGVLAAPILFGLCQDLLRK